MTPSLPPGYRALNELGRGGGGVVLRAREEATGREVALKLLLEAERDPRRRERFRREAELAAGLNHTGIVKVHRAGETPGAMWIVYELVQGGRTLEDVWREEDPRLCRERRVREVLEVAAAVGYAHARGVVHRDLKPQNVLVDPEGRVRVTDFGLAAAQGLSRLTRTGHAVGTPHHMAPEQAAGDKSALGPAIDCWALGVLLYEALTGRVPFAGPDAASVMLQLHTRDPDPPRSLDPAVSPRLEAVCLKALQRDPALRQADAQAFARELEAALETPAPRRGRRLSPLLAIAGLGLAAVLLGLALGLGPSEAPAGGAGDEGEAARRRRLVLEAWSAGEVALARERLREAEAAGPLDLSCRPWVLALAGEPGEALRALTAQAPPGVVARLAAQAGEEARCLEALLLLAETQPAQARALGLELRRLLPGLPLVGAPTGSGPWPALARAEAALARGDAALAAQELAALRQARPPGADVRHALALLWLRAGLARGQTGELAGALREAWEAREDDPLRAAEVLGWAALVEPLLPPVSEPPLVGLSGSLREEAARRAPGDPRARAALGSGAGWGALAAARGALAAGDQQAWQLLRQAAPDAPLPPPGSFARTELALCRAGVDGPEGVLLAAAGDLALAALEGADRASAQAALRQLESVAALRSSSPAGWVLRAAAARAAHDLPRARQAAEEALRAAPGDPWPLLERARTSLALLQDDRLLADGTRAGERGGQEHADPQARQRVERPVAAALSAVADSFRLAREAAPAGDPLEEQARLEGASVRVERAWRLTRAGADARAVAAARESALEELRPLLARIPREALLTARRGLLAALRGRGTSQLRAEAVRAAELELARAGAGVDERARLAAALAAAASPADDAVAWAEVWMALQGDLPARALLAARAARSAPTPDERRRRQEAATALLPDHPAVLLLGEGARIDPAETGPGLGLAPGSALALGRAALASPQALLHAEGLLGAAPGEPAAYLARLEADVGPGSAVEPAVLVARALILSGIGQPERGGLIAAAEAAHQALLLRAAQGAPLAACHLLRAHLLLRLDPVCLPDARQALALAHAAAPWDAAVELVELDLVSAPEASRRVVDRLLAGGHLPGAWRLSRPGQPADVRANLEAIDRALPGLDPTWPPSAFEWAAELHRGGLPLVSLLLRIRTAGELWDGCDLTASPPLEEALRALEEQPGPRSVAGATWWLLRGERGGFARSFAPGDEAERERSRREALGEALERACQGAVLAAPAGAPDLPDLTRVDAAGVPLGWRASLAEHDALEDLPRDLALRAWWLRVHRAEQASLVRGRAWLELRPDPPHRPLAPEDLPDPWGVSWVVLRGLQDGDPWTTLELLRAGLLGEARLAFERLAAFRRSESPPGTWINIIQREVRDPGRHSARLPWLEWALEVVETPQVAAWDPPAFQALAADLHLDLVGLSAGEARAAHLGEAWRLFQALPPIQPEDPEPDEEPGWWEPPLTSAWRRVRLWALSGTDPAALRSAVDTLRQAADDSYNEPDGRGRVRWWLQSEPAPTRRLLEAIPELQELVGNPR